MAFKLKTFDKDFFLKLGILPGMIDCEYVDRDTLQPITSVNDNCAEEGIECTDNCAEEGIECADNCVADYIEEEEDFDTNFHTNGTFNLKDYELEVNNDNIIKNISFDQSEILHNIMMLYNDGKPFDCDITASELKFYENQRNKYNIPVPRLLFDVCPLDERVQKLEKWGSIPLEDESIHSIVIDLPFVISPAKAPSFVNKKDGASLIANRFSAYYPVDNLYYSYYNWIKNAYRVLDKGGILVFKCQSMISGGIRHNVEEFSYMAAEKHGFKMVDKFILEAKARLIGKTLKTGQKHSRSYTSVFMVFEKPKKHYSKDFVFSDFLEKCEEEYHNGFKNIVEK